MIEQNGVTTLDLTHCLYVLRVSTESLQLLQQVRLVFLLLSPYLSSFSLCEVAGKECRAWFSRLEGMQGIGGGTCPPGYLLPFIYFSKDKSMEEKPGDSPIEHLALLRCPFRYVLYTLCEKRAESSMNKIVLPLLSVTVGFMPSSMSSMELPLSSSFMGPSCWLRASTPPAQSGRSLATTRPPSAARA